MVKFERNRRPKRRRTSWLKNIPLWTETPAPIDLIKTTQDRDLCSYTVVCNWFNKL